MFNERSIACLGYIDLLNSSTCHSSVILSAHSPRTLEYSYFLRSYGRTRRSQHSPIPPGADFNSVVTDATVAHRDIQSGRSYSHKAPLPPYRNRDEHQPTPFSQAGCSPELADCRWCFIFQAELRSRTPKRGCRSMCLRTVRVLV